SDFRYDRAALLIQCYDRSSQHSQVLATAAPLVHSGDVGALLQPADAIRVLYAATTAITKLQSPSPAELSMGEKSARALMTFDQKPAGVDESAWTQTKAQLRATAKVALLKTATAPGLAALSAKPPDCATAESSFARALNEYPESTFAAYNLARA